MNLELVIPSKGRIQKLENCLNSIFHSTIKTPITIYLYFSVESEYTYFTEMFKDLDNIKTELLKEYRVPDFWNAHLQKTKADAICYLNDDILVFSDTIECIMTEFEKYYPDNDGVMGLRQVNLPQDQAVEGAFGVIGIKYAERFENREVWCKDYERFFADFELWRYAKSINKFHFSTISRIKHLHPITDGTLIDATHKEVRKWLSKDKYTFKLRESKGHLWGKDFNLINKERYENQSIGSN